MSLVLRDFDLVLAPPSDPPLTRLLCFSDCTLSMADINLFFTVISNTSLSLS